MKKIIGTSNYWLNTMGFSLLEQESILNLLGINAIEFSSGEDTHPIINFNCFKNFQYKSYHPPSKNPRFKKVSIIPLIKRFIRKNNINTIVIHPINLSQTYFKELKRENIPVAIENMDKTQNQGKSIEDLNFLVEKYSFDFVLDVQHAYENDPSMKYAEDLFKNFKKRIKEIHISGEREGNNHSLIYKSKNKDAIVNFAKKILHSKNIPVIIEGKYTNINELKKEILFVKKKILFDLNNNT